MANNLLKQFGQMSKNINPTGTERPPRAPRTITAMTVTSQKLRDLTEAVAASMLPPKNGLIESTEQINVGGTAFCGVGRADRVIVIDFNVVSDADALYDELTEWLKAKSIELKGGQ